MIRVVVVDDHEIVRRGIVEMLDSVSDFEVVAEASTVSSALPRIEATGPDVAVLDVRLPDGNGINLCREIRSRRPDIKCLILTAFDDDDAVVAAVVAGASGYLLKDVSGSGLVHAVRTAAAGESLLHPQAARHVGLRASSEERDDPRFGSLNLRERQVLGLIAEGMTNRQIAERLGLTEKTVESNVMRMLRKLGLELRTQAAADDSPRYWRPS